MGDIADQLVEDEMFGTSYIDETERQKIWYKRTPAEKKIAAIRKEIAIDIKSGTPVDEARKKANLKYGKGWRERGWIANSDNQWTEEDLKEFM